MQIEHPKLSKAVLYNSTMLLHLRHALQMTSRDMPRVVRAGVVGLFACLLAAQTLGQLHRVVHGSGTYTAYPAQAANQTQAIHDPVSALSVEVARHGHEERHAHSPAHGNSAARSPVGATYSFFAEQLHNCALFDAASALHGFAQTYVALIHSPPPFLRGGTEASTPARITVAAYWARGPPSLV